MTSSSESNTPELVVEAENVQLYQGSCLDLLTVIPRSSVTLAIFSPPYPNVDQPEPDYVTFEEPQNFNSSHAFLTEVYRVVYGALQDGGRMVVNISNIHLPGNVGLAPNVAATIKNALQVGFVLREEFIWSKKVPEPLPAGSFPLPCGVLTAGTHESCLVFQKPVAFSQRVRDVSKIPEHIREKSLLGSDAHSWLRDSVWEIRPDNEGRKMGHPFTYPEELPKRFILLYSFYGDTVLDPFSGSGTTLKACQKYGRQGIGFELSDKYVNITKNRFAQASLF